MSFFVKRRDLLVAGLGTVVSPFVLAQSSSPAQQVTIDEPVNVVKLMSLSCNVCRATEAFDPVLASAVRTRGGRFVWAPLPTHPEDQQAAKELVYYAARDRGRDFSEAVKDSLYRGVQDKGLPLFDFMQVYTWFMSDIPSYLKDFDSLFKAAQAQGAREALTRAIRLANSTGTRALPHYLVLKGSEVRFSIDPTHPKAPTLTALREELLNKINSL